MSIHPGRVRLRLISFPSLHGGTGFLALCAAILLSGFPGLALAQVTTEFPVEHFEMAPAQSRNIYSISGSAILPHEDFSLDLTFHTSRGQLSQLSPLGNVRENLVDVAVRSDLSLALGLYDVAEVAAVLPITVFQTGGDLTTFGMPGQDVTGASLSDVRLLAKTQLLNPKYLWGIGAGIQASVYFPTGNSDGFTAADGFRTEGRLIIDWVHSKGYKIAANLSYQQRPRTQSINYVSDDIIRWGLGAEFPTGIKKLWGRATIFGDQQTTKNRSFANPIIAVDDGKGEPAEAQAGVRYEISDRWQGWAGGGTGLTRGIGSPDWRIFLGVGYRFVANDFRARDVDSDGIYYGPFNRADQCPDIPEDRDGFQDNDGCPEEDNDGDGIVDFPDWCPMEPEDLDGFEDADGCPDPDNDFDGMLDAEDKCPLEAEDLDSFEDTDGCPEEGGESKFQITGLVTTVLEPIKFEVGRGVLNKGSYPLLDEIAKVLIAAPHINRIRIEGHTDSQGTDAYNMDLSQKRASAVREYLVGKGVEPGRLTAVGFGESQPVANNDTAAGRAKNRRVEFVIIEISGKTLEPTEVPGTGEDTSPDTGEAPGKAPHEAQPPATPASPAPSSGGAAEGRNP